MSENGPDQSRARPHRHGCHCGFAFRSPPNILGVKAMKNRLRASATVGALLAVFAFAPPSFAQTPGGILKIGHFDSPASMSMLEESTAAVNRPMMGVFNNLVMFKQDEPQNTLDSIVPELATEWSWSEDGTELTFLLHRGVKWHD